MKACRVLSKSNFRSSVSCQLSYTIATIRYLQFNRLTQNYGHLPEKEGLKKSDNFWGGFERFLKFCIWGLVLYMLFTIVSCMQGAAIFVGDIACTGLDIMGERESEECKEIRRQKDELLSG